MSGLPNVAALRGLAQGAVDASLHSLTKVTIAQAWATLSPLPLGKQAFAKLIKLKIPYSGSIGAVVQELHDGHAVVTLQDRRAVRNHLDCVHAIALANLGEMTSGIAMFHAIDGRSKGIVTELRMEYLKKARGTLTATCDVEVTPVTAPREQTVVGIIRDKQGEVVANCHATWSLKPL